MKFGKQMLAAALVALTLSGAANAAIPAQATVLRASATSLPVSKGFRAGPRLGRKRNLLGAAPLLSALFVAGAVAATVVVADQVAGDSGDSN